MHAFMLRRLVAASTLGLLAAACGGADPVSGSWNQPNGAIAIPATLGGGTVDANVTLSFDDTVSPPTFDLKMDLSFMGLTDKLDAQGTYAESGGSMTLDFTGFAIAPGSSDTSNTESGNPCITLNDLAGATVCFMTPQTDGFQVTGDTLTIAIDNQIAGGDAAPTTLTLSRVQ
jgi:hypothetical protein